MLNLLKRLMNATMQGFQGVKKGLDQAKNWAADKAKPVGNDSPKSQSGQCSEKCRSSFSLSRWKIAMDMMLLMFTTDLWDVISLNFIEMQTFVILSIMCSIHHLHCRRHIIPNCFCINLLKYVFSTLSLSLEVMASPIRRASMPDELLHTRHTQIWCQGKHF